MHLTFCSRSKVAELSAILKRVFSKCSRSLRVKVLDTNIIVPGSKAWGCSIDKSAFHPSEIKQMSTRNSKVNCLIIVALQPWCSWNLPRKRAIKVLKGFLKMKFHQHCVTLCFKNLLNTKKYFPYANYGL